MTEDFPNAYAPHTTDPEHYCQRGAGFDLVQDGNGVLKGFRPAEHVLFGRSLPHRRSADQFSPDTELSFALAWELESTPAEIDAFRQATMERWTQEARELSHLRQGYVQRSSPCGCRAHASCMTMTAARRSLHSPSSTSSWSHCRCLILCKHLLLDPLSTDDMRHVDPEFYR